MFDKLLSVFSPDKSIKILVHNIQETLGHPVRKFEMRIFTEENKIDFLIYLPAEISLNSLPPQTAFKYNNEKRSHLYKFKDGAQLSKVVMHIIKPKLPPEYVLQYLIVKYSDREPLTAEAYGLHNGEKEKKTITF